MKTTLLETKDYKCKECRTIYKVPGRYQVNKTSSKTYFVPSFKKSEMLDSEKCLSCLEKKNREKEQKELQEKEKLFILTTDRNGVKQEIKGIKEFQQNKYLINITTLNNINIMFNINNLASIESNIEVSLNYVK